MCWCIGYFLPNTESEADRLNMQHHIFALSFSDRLSLAPLSESDLDGKHVLDIGTGTGIWAVDFAKQYPNCHVTGFDISPCNPTSPPPNTTFLTHNAESTPWPFTQKFHYIHGRAMMSCFDSAALVIQEAYQNLEPGGWLELQDVVAPWTDVDGSLSNSALLHFHTLTISAAAQIGRDVCQVITYPSLLAAAGFSSVTEMHYQWPIGPWAMDPRLKRVGEMFREDLDVTVEPIAERLYKGVLGMGDSEVGEIVRAARRDAWDVKRVRGYMPG
ncbi:S-adenosyl-L-methionine-dependent methyltransferase [Mollisia scopiformis]|uniref:S-adenosyl-L-methionine-dependent methyltransferase n=1 Tax=Mollisia scopiformis TaxID=149040 RepID=A0A194X5G0_MOLSC|nr:S-adenosyl-L-methionine-dependent methyltransferase [Mollisia scopiformis]KUJ15418.1 S-adenosyl-L-methionine-dependent methyltransferase [Mollisia scopiformis]